MKRVLVLDIGGSSIKAWLSGSTVEDCCSASHPLPLREDPENGLTEFDPRIWWSIVQKTVASIFAAQGNIRPSVVLISTIRQGFVLCDSTGEIGFGIHNADKRGIASAEQMNEKIAWNDLYDLTGHWFAPQLPLSKLIAIKTQDPNRWKKLNKLMFVHDWLAWRFTGVWKNERTLATTSQLCNVNDHKWASQLIDLFDLNHEIFGELIKSGEIIGVINCKEMPKLQGIELIAGAGDAHFLAHGARLDTSDTVVVTGSTTPIQTITENLPLDNQRRPWISAPVTEAGWAVEMNAGYTGAALDWLLRNFGWTTKEGIDAAWRNSSVGARGVIALTGCPKWDQESWSGSLPFSFTGLSTGHNRADLVRAIVEGHAFAIRANVEGLDQILYQTTEHLVLTGGWVSDSNFCQLVADVTERVVYSISSFDASLKASTMLVNQHIPEIMPHQTNTTIFEPRTKNLNYDYFFTKYCEMYEHSILTTPNQR